MILQARKGEPGAVCLIGFFLNLPGTLHETNSKFTAENSNRWKMSRIVGGAFAYVQRLLLEGSDGNELLQVDDLKQVLFSPPFFGGNEMV